jgi:hypothetical protein
MANFLKVDPVLRGALMGTENMEHLVSLEKY